MAQIFNGLDDRNVGTSKFRPRYFELKQEHAFTIFECLGECAIYFLEGRVVFCTTHLDLKLLGWFLYLQVQFEALLLNFKVSVTNTCRAHHMDKKCTLFLEIGPKALM